MKIRVWGVVQGVNFRSSAKHKADSLGIAGFARNEPNSSVLIEVEGPRAKLQEFLLWCHQGPPAAQVESVESSVHEPIGHQGFKTY